MSDWCSVDTSIPMQHSLVGNPGMWKLVIQDEGNSRASSRVFGLWGNKRGKISTEMHIENLVGEKGSL